MSRSRISEGVHRVGLAGAVPLLLIAACWAASATLLSLNAPPVPKVIPDAATWSGAPLDDPFDAYLRHHRNLSEAFSFLALFLPLGIGWYASARALGWIADGFFAGPKQ